MIFQKACKVLKKFTEANARKMDKKFGCKNTYFDFHAGKFPRDIVLKQSRYAKATYALKITRAALIYSHVDKNRKLKK